MRLETVFFYDEAIGELYEPADVAPSGTPDPPPPPPPGGPFYVDRSSIGGACSDSRSAAQAAAASTPWCSVERAAAADGATVLVRAGTYPSVTIDGSINGALVTFKPSAPRRPSCTASR